jgi:hypothetical protein
MTMHTKRLTTKPTHEVISAIQAMDLESVKVRLMDPELGEGWTREYADGIEAAYKNFLTMIVKYQEHAENILVAKDVDELWHTHILQTLKYAADCQAVFGTYLHHSPHIGERTAADLERRVALAHQTQAIYEREFGGAVAAAWSGSHAGQVKAAFSGVAIGSQVSAQGAAFSGVPVNARDAAFSGLAISAERAAFSIMEITAERAAFSALPIAAERAAWSGIAIRAEAGTPVTVESADVQS